MYVIWAALTFASIQVKRKEHQLMLLMFFLTKQIEGLSRCHFPKDSTIVVCARMVKLIKQLINKLIN